MQDVGDDPSRPVDPSTTPVPTTDPLRSIHTDSLVQLLHELGISLIVTTYQAGKVILVRADGDRVNTHFKRFDVPMGVAVSPRRLAIATRYQIWELGNYPDVARHLEHPHRHDACFIPRIGTHTGDIRTHELAWINNELWLVNTRFSCLCTLDPDASFIPRWKPPFISAYADEDRCHLNGLEVIDGEPAYVTALGQSDTREGWRDNKATGGCLIDVRSNDIVLGNLCMPHSPRVHDKHVWLLESGRGTLAQVDVTQGTTIPIATLPGFTRGLDFVGPYAFVGLSQVRESATFGDLPITQRLPESNRKCGVWVIDTRTSQTIAFLSFEQGVQEVFDVRVLPNTRYPELMDFQDEANRRTFVLPTPFIKQIEQT